MKSFLLLTVLLSVMSLCLLLAPEQIHSDFVCQKSAKECAWDHAHCLDGSCNFLEIDRDQGN